MRASNGKKRDGHSELAPALLLAAACLSACAGPQIVYVQTPVVSSNKVPDQGDIYLYKSSTTAPVTLANSIDNEIPCGATSDGRVVYSRATAANLDDIYIVNGDGTGTKPLVASIANEVCRAVTSNNLVLFESRGPGAVGGDIRAVSANGGVPQVVADISSDQHFLALAPDQSVIFTSRNAQTNLYDLYSTKIGGAPVALFVSLPAAPSVQNSYTFNAVTSDNRVVYTSANQYKQGFASQNIYSIKTDGTGRSVLAQNPPYTEQFCAVTLGNRVLYTEISQHTVNGVSQTNGDVYAVDPAGKNTVKLNPSVPIHNDTCVGSTDDGHAIVSRDQGFLELHSFPGDGTGTDVLLAKGSASLGAKVSPYFNFTIGGRVVFNTVSSAENNRGTTDYTYAISSVKPDASGLAVLLGPTPLVTHVAGSTVNAVLYTQQAPPAKGSFTPSPANLYTVPVDGSAAGAPLAKSPQNQALGFVFY